MRLPGTKPSQAGVPARMDEVWPLLRAAGLSAEQLHRLASAWQEDAPVRARLDLLVQSGVLTAYQAEQVLSGKAGRLRLGPYRILDRLGSGGAGTVYKAEHILMKRLVALKVLGRTRRQRPRPPGASPVTSPRRAELVTAGRLSHPHIVAAYDAARLRGRLVLVLEYVEGIDLERLATEAGPLPVPLACEVIRQTALALDYLHGRGLVHRDVKPANLLLVRGPASAGRPMLPDGPPMVKLIDLGLACGAGNGGEGLCGTMDYVAPERGIDPDLVDIRGDLYSLGCTFYHMLTGRVPYPGGSWTGKLVRHRLEEAEPIRELRPEVPAEVAALVARLMAREPGDRYPAPRAVVEAIEALQLEMTRRETTNKAGEPIATSIRRFSNLGPWALMATVLTGSTLGGVVRLAVPAPAASAVRNMQAAPAPVLKIVVSGIEQPFSDLADAVAAASNGAAITLHGPGPFRTAPISLHGKALTFRAASTVRPIVEQIGSSGRNWEALLASDRPLTLEGIDLHGGHSEIAAPVVAVEGAMLHLRDCSVRAGRPGPLLALRGGSAVVIENSQLMARRQALTVEIAADRPCRINVRKSHVEVRDPTGPALLLWSPEMTAATAVRVNLAGSTVVAGRVVACRSLAGPIEWTATDNQLTFRQALVSFEGYRDPDAWRRTLRWTGRDNRYDSAGTWLRLEGRPGPATNELAWQRLWASR
jgi:serine/threonine protein kinase